MSHNFLSDVLLVGNNLNPQIRSILFNYKQYVVRLNIDEFFKNPHSIKRWCKKYNNFFINNHKSHIIKGNLNNVCNERFSRFPSKTPKHWEPKQINFEESLEEMQISISEFTERISNDKGIHKSYFSEWKTNIFTHWKLN